MTASPFDDTTDFEDAGRGFVAAMVPCVVTADDGRVVWDNDAYAFLDDACPDTANPSLWRQSQLCAKQGLFEVTDGIYQVRGLDLSNMTLVEGDEGVIVIDPLISKETAAAALALYREHRGDRPVTAVIYTHAHGDHFGGVHGVYRDGIPIVAGHGFMDAAVAENVYAGAAMNRRAEYMYGRAAGQGAQRARSAPGWARRPRWGRSGSSRRRSRSPTPARRRRSTGCCIRFQMTPGTECPVEMNFLFPRAAGVVHGRERDAQPPQPADAARRGRTRRRGSGRTTSTRRSTCSPTTWTSPSPRTTGRRGDATAS